MNKSLVLATPFLITLVCCSPKVGNVAKTTVQTKGKDTIEKKEMLHNILVEQVNAFEKSPSEYLFVKDGILVDAKDVIRLKELSPSVLISVDALKLNAAVREIYGDAAREHTILITTHNQGY